MVLYIKCQLCLAKSVLTHSPHDETLCNWCKNFVKIKRTQGLSDSEIIAEYKKHPHSKGE